MVLATLLPFANRINTWAQNLGQRIGDALNISWIGPWIARQVKNVAPWLYNALNYDLGRAAQRAIESLGGWLRDGFKWVGQTMVWGWIEGLVSRAGDLWQTLLNMAKAAWEAVRNFFESRSPSQLMRRLGQTLPQGAALGVEEDTPRFEEAVSRMARIARDRMREHRVGINLRPEGVPGGFSGPTRTVSVRTVEAAPTPGSAGLQDIGRIVSEAMRRVPGLEEPIEVTIPVYVGGQKLDERVIRIVGGEAREKRRARGQMAGYSPGA